MSFSERCLNVRILERMHLFLCEGTQAVDILRISCAALGFVWIYIFLCKAERSKLLTCLFLAPFEPLICYSSHFYMKQETVPFCACGFSATSLICPGFYLAHPHAAPTPQPFCQFSTESELYNFSWFQLLPMFLT